MYFLLVYSTSLLYTRVFVWNINLFFWLTIAITYFFVCCFLVSKLCLTLCGVRVDCSPLGYSLLENSTGVGCSSLPQGIFSDLGIEHQSATLKADSVSLSHQGSLVVYISYVTKTTILRAFKKNECNIKLSIFFFFKNLWVFMQINGHEIYFMTTRRNLCYLL